MISGYLCLVLLLLLVIKIIVRVTGSKRWNRIFGRIHKPLGVSLILLGILHALITMPVWKTRAVLVVATGFMVWFFCVITGMTYVTRKRYPTLWMKYHRISVCLLVLSLVGHMVIYFVDFGSYMEEMQTITIDGMNAEGVADGTYYGEYDAGYINVRVKVVVQDEQMEITLLRHDNEHGKKAEQVIGEMEHRQTTAVDTVSGATNSSHVIMKAVENALSQGEKK